MYASATSVEIMFGGPPFIVVLRAELHPIAERACETDEEAAELVRFTANELEGLRVASTPEAVALHAGVLRMLFSPDLD